MSDRAEELISDLDGYFDRGERLDVVALLVDAKELLDTDPHSDIADDALVQIRVWLSNSDPECPDETLSTVRQALRELGGV